MQIEWVDHGSGVAEWAMQRPEVLNALGMEMAQTLVSFTDQARDMKELRAVVITSRVERAFSVGADLKERRTMTSAEMDFHTSLLRKAFEAIEQLPVPALAAVQGFCLGGGMEMAMCADLRISSDDAVFGLPEVSLGAFPGAGGAVRLPRIIGMSRALDLLFTGRRISGNEAMQLGFVNRLASKEEVRRQALEVASTIAANGPLGVRAIKRLVRLSQDMELRGAFAFSDVLRTSLNDTRDYREALAAFSERRPPQFTGC